MQKYVIRPAPVPPPPKTVEMENGEKHPLDQDAWKVVFSQLEPHDLARCLRVCKTWYRWVMDHTLWQTIDLTNTRISKQHLIGIVKRQPLALNLNYSDISFRQLEWLIARLPCVRSLSMVGNSWAAVSALCSSTCPMLSSLDISWVTCVQDNCLKELLAPPIDHRPGIINNTSRFHFCTQLVLTGSDITDAAVEFVQLNLPKLEKLSLSCCIKITDKAIKVASSMMMLKEFDVSKCRNLTAEALQHVKSLPHLKMLCILGCLAIDDTAIATFTRESGGQYYKRPGLVILP